MPILAMLLRAAPSRSLPPCRVDRLRLVAEPLFPRSRRIRAARVGVKIGAGTLSAPLAATLYGAVGQPATFEQAPLRAIEAWPRADLS